MVEAAKAPKPETVTAINKLNLSSKYGKFAPPDSVKLAVKFSYLALVAGQRLTAAQMNELVSNLTKAREALGV